jgi:hypothetical protein
MQGYLGLFFKDMENNFQQLLTFKAAKGDGMPKHGKYAEVCAFWRAQAMT